MVPALTLLKPFWQALFFVVNGHPSDMLRNKIQTCIVIDDSEIDIFLTTRLFKRMKVSLQIQHHVSLEAYLADSANTDLNLANNTIIIVDLHLNRSNGIDVIRTLRKNKLESSMVMGVCSGSENPADKVEALAAGADFFAPKPLNLSALEAICQSVPNLEIEKTSDDQVHLTMSDSVIDQASP